MKREIKFRGFNSDINKITETFEIGSFLSEKTCDIIMQYTGKKDKNGIEIYEGDICKTNDDFYKDDKKNKKLLITIKWSQEACAYFACKGKEEVPLSWFSHFEFSTIEVIGNIYENPELIKDKL